MSNNHIITRNIGNLRGFSTDSIFIRPPNVATIANNIQKSPDNGLQLRRGYQCQIGLIGSMGIGTFDNPATNHSSTVCIGINGLLYNKLTKQIYFTYNGQVTGSISAITQDNPAKVTSVGHDLITGASVIIRNVQGMVELNNQTYTITVLDADHFTLDGVDSTSFSAYTSGGTWSIAFADNRYLTFTIFTDPRYIYTNPGWSVMVWDTGFWGSPSGPSITCNITVNRAAQITADATLTNTVDVAYGHEIAVNDVIQFYTTVGVYAQATVTAVTDTTITFSGFPVTVASGTFINQFLDILFGQGFYTDDPYLISTFISTITDPVTGVYGLQVDANGLTDFPAAFIQILEPVIITNSSTLTLDYWYWEIVNFTVNPPFPGSASITNQNSPDFENASMAAYDDVIYIANGYDYPQKYDGQTVYRAGMPIGVRPNDAEDNTSATIKPFSDGNVYQYAITYEQIDNFGHIVEGALSPILSHTVGATAAIDLTVTDIIPSPGNNWNTNVGIAPAQTASVYGPDLDGFYYDLVTLNTSFSLKIGDSAYFLDTTAATVDGDQTGFEINVLAGHVIIPGDLIYVNSTVPSVIFRQVVSVTSTSITVNGDAFTVADTTSISVYKTGLVFGNVAIVNGSQTSVNTIVVSSGHTIQTNDIVGFTDSSGRIQQRTVTGTTSTSVTISGNPVSIKSLYLIASTNQRDDAINIRMTGSQAITIDDSLAVNQVISNNLRINIYRTDVGVDFDQSGDIFLVASIPNNSLAGTQIYTDSISDAELGAVFANPDIELLPPPISKYLRAFGTQMFYAGGETGNDQNSDLVAFSLGNFPESLPLATYFFNVPNVDDDITGIGVSGSTLVTTKNHSLWATTGNFITGQVQTVQIAPGTNIGCVAHASIASVGALMYFLHSNGLYAITENQLYPTDQFGNPIPLSLPIDSIFRESRYLPFQKFVLKRAVAINYTKDNQYILFLPCENANSTIRTANSYSMLFVYDYQDKNWFTWDNMNCAGGMVVIDDDLYFQERYYSGLAGNVGNLYKQHRFYRLVDHADHAGPQKCEWLSSWEDLGQPEVRKKFCRCILLMDRLSSLLQYNQPKMQFSSYVNRLPGLQSTISNITTVDNIRNSSWNYSSWGWGFWSGYEDSFITVNLKQGTVAKSMQVGFKIEGINMDILFAGYQLETIPENRKTVVR